MRRGLKFLQSDTALQGGNSGGPLIDARGRVVGVAVSGIVSSSLDDQGLNFFIPIEDALAALKIRIRTEASLGQ